MEGVMGGSEMGMGPVFTMSGRSEMGYPYPYPNYTEMEKRQLFLRSYQFSRKKSVAERIKGSFFRVKRVVWSRLRSARKIRKIVWFRLRYGFFYSTRKRNFLRLHNPNASTTTSCLFKYSVCVFN
ncbi:hypothetical protein HYC85_010018 [Camellia sinensis]|uniref:Uncharacterized protein n=1 Tax=Camellia sinensis TaxID=4442 RepID=A0A7J7HJB6_CAMSI|nr:hypothetical protein HYC85_010018 [Camellia sinensis]